VTDDLELSGTMVTSAIFAVATSTSDRWSGILGIGLDGLEASGSPYHNIIDEMQSQGLIRTRAYSLYLDDRGANTLRQLFVLADALQRLAAVL
jgi:Eukaryotic aspartyl protease